MKNWKKYMQQVYVEGLGYKLPETWAENKIFKI